MPIGAVLDHEAEHRSRWPSSSSISAQIGCSAARLHEWVKKNEIDSGKRAGLTSDAAEKMKALERDNRELLRASADTTNADIFEFGVFLDAVACPFAAQT